MFTRVSTMSYRHRCSIYAASARRYNDAIRGLSAAACRQRPSVLTAEKLMSPGARKDFAAPTPQYSNHRSAQGTFGVMILVITENLPYSYRRKCDFFTTSPSYRYADARFRVLIFQGSFHLHITVLLLFLITMLAAIREESDGARCFDCNTLKFLMTKVSKTAPSHRANFILQAMRPHTFRHQFTSLR